MKRFFDILKILGPVTLMLVPGVPPLLIPVIIEGIRRAEVLGDSEGLTGAQKKASAMELVSLGVLGVNTGAGKVVVDPLLIENAVSLGIDATVATIKVIEGTPVATTATDAPPIPPAVPATATGAKTTTKRI